MPSGTVTIPSGQASTTLTINVAGDTTLEQDENFTVSLTDPPNNTLIEAAAASGTILNDENNLPTGTVTISGTAAEDQALTVSNTLADVRRASARLPITGCEAALIQAPPARPMC